MIQPPDELNYDPLADEWLADALLREGKYPEAFSVLSKLSESNSAYAMVALGWIYENGNLGEIDLQSAEKYYSMAASLNYGEGFLELGRLKHRLGFDKEAREVFSAGSKISNVSCMARLGSMMANGEGGEKNIDEAIITLRLPVEMGHPFAKRAMYKIEHDKSKSVFRKIVFYCQVVYLIIITIYHTYRNPYSEKSIR